MGVKKGGGAGVARGVEKGLRGAGGAQGGLLVAGETFKAARAVGVGTVGGLEGAAGAVTAVGSAAAAGDSAGVGMVGVAEGAAAAVSRSSILDLD